MLCVLYTRAEAFGELVSEISWEHVILNVIYLKGGYSEVGIGLFSQAPSDMTRENGLNLLQGKFTLDLGTLSSPKGL